MYDNVLCNLFATGDTDAIAAYGLKVHGEESPTWTHAMKSEEANHWRDAARAELQNFERHGVYVEVSEDQLPSWNAHSKRASEVIDMMWESNALTYIVIDIRSQARADTRAGDAVRLWSGVAMRHV
eukprot:3836729-Pleurochrysis_carterae.AAC.1